LLLAVYVTRPSEAGQSSSEAATNIHLRE